MGSDQLRFGTLLKGRPDTGTRLAPSAVAGCVLALTIALMSVVGIAATATSADATGRYTMSPSGSGFVRLDTQTGRMSFCQKADADWACVPMNDPAAKLAAELEELKAENAKLKAEVARLAALKGAEGDQSFAPPDTGIPGVKLPSEKEVDRALGYFNRVFKRFRDAARELRDEAQKPLDPPSEAPQSKPQSKPL